MSIFEIPALELVAGNMIYKVVLNYLKTITFAPESLSPRTKDAWFFSSLSTRVFLLVINLGMLREFVANPIPDTIES